MFEHCLKLTTTIGVSGLMFILVPAHADCPRQNPESHKTVVHRAPKLATPLQIR